MANDRPFFPVPKPEGTRKSKAKGVTKTVNLEAVDERSERRKEINNNNRQFGKSVERSVAKLVGGERTPMSGAIKNSNRNLTGDVEVKDAKGRDFIKIECKGSAAITPSGEKTFNIKKSVLDQTFKESDEAGEIGLTWIHWKNANYTQDDYGILHSKHVLELIELAKIGSAVRNGTIKIIEEE